MRLNGAGVLDRLAGRIKAVVLIGNFAPHVPIEGHAENELARRDAGFLECAHRGVGGVFGEVGGAGEERSVVAGYGAGAWLIVVVGQEIDAVEIAPRLGHLRVGKEVVFGAGSDGAWAALWRAGIGLRAWMRTKAEVFLT